MRGFRICKTGFLMTRLIFYVNIIVPCPQQLSTLNTNVCTRVNGRETYAYVSVTRKIRQWPIIFSSLPYLLYLPHMPLIAKHITQTCPCNILQYFTAVKNDNFQIIFFLYFSYFCSKHRLWVHVRNASMRRF